MIDTNRYIPFIIKHKLTQPQFLLLYLLYKKEIHHINAYKKAFPTPDGSMIGDIPLKQLIDEGYLARIKNHGNEKVLSGELILTDKFTYIFVDSFQAGEELIEAYPAFMVKQGNKMPLKFGDAGNIRKIYAIAISHSKEEHREVLKDVEYAKENGLIMGKLENFILSKAWNDVRKIRLGIVDENELETDMVDL